MEVTETTTARMWVDDEGIGHYVSVGVASTRETVTESLKAFGEIGGGRPLPVLFDSRGWPSGDPASWVQFINTIETVCSAAAVIVDSDSEPKLGTFPTLLDSLMIPFRMFIDENEALEFLRSQASD